MYITYVEQITGSGTDHWVFAKLTRIQTSANSSIIGKAFIAVNYYQSDNTPFITLECYYYQHFTPASNYDCKSCTSGLKVKNNICQTQSSCIINRPGYCGENIYQEMRDKLMDGVNSLKTTCNEPSFYFNGICTDCSSLNSSYKTQEKMCVDSCLPNEYILENQICKFDNLCTISPNKLLKNIVGMDEYYYCDICNQYYENYSCVSSCQINGNTPNIDNCEPCNGGNVELNKTTCIADGTCPEGYYQDINTSNSNAKFCKSCILINQVEENGTCVNNCILNGNVVSNNKCQPCPGGNVELNNTSCVADGACPEGYYQDTLNSGAKFCFNCVAIGQIEENGVCTQNCIINGNVNLNNKCQPCPGGNVELDNISCVADGACPDGYYQDTSNSGAKFCLNCVINGQIEENGSCVLNCSNSGNVLSNNKCQPCPGGNVELNNTSCVADGACPEGYYQDTLNSGAKFCFNCVAIGQIEENGVCTQNCIINGNVNLNNKCQPCPGGNVELDNISCVADGACPDGYYQDTSNSGSKFCFNCATLGLVVENSACVQKCQIDGNILLNNKCLPCQNGKYELNKTTCVLEEECPIESIPYINNQNIDSKYCKFCSNNLTKESSNCVENCTIKGLKITSGTNGKYCSNCGNFYEHNGTCVEICPDLFGSASIDGNNLCILCSIEEPINRFVQNKICVASCSNEYVVNETNKTCVLCNKNEYIYKNFCHSVCPDKTKHIDLPFKHCEEICPNQLLENSNCVNNCEILGNYKNANDICVNCKNIHIIIIHLIWYLFWFIS